jgi:SAM-dependent methyltransferase
MSSFCSELPVKPCDLIPTQSLAACAPDLISQKGALRGMTAKEQLFGIYKTIKAQLSEPEQARLLYKAKGLYEKAFPKTKQGGDHRSKNFKGTKQTDTMSFCKHAAINTGKHERTIRRLVQLGEYLGTNDPEEQKINNQAVERLKGTRFENSVVELNKLFKEPAAYRLAYAEKMVDDRKVRAVNTAKFLVQRDEMLKKHTTYEFNPQNLKCCDFREFLAGVPDHTAQHIISDIPYENNHAWILEPLAKEAQRVLKPGGLLITMVGQWNTVFPQAVNTFTQYLEWKGMFGCFYAGNTAGVHNQHIAASWKPLLILKNGAALDKKDIHESLFTRDSIHTPQFTKVHHPHEQNVLEFYHVIRSLSLPDDLIIDPFCGSGTVGVAALRWGCRFMGCDDGSCNEDGSYDGPGVGDKWIRVAQRRLDEEVERLKGTESMPNPADTVNTLLLPAPTEPQPIISAELPVLDATELQLTA